MTQGWQIFLLIAIFVCALVLRKHSRDRANRNLPPNSVDPNDIVGTILNPYRSLSSEQKQILKTRWKVFLYMIFFTLLGCVSVFIAAFFIYGVFEDGAFTPSDIPESARKTKDAIKIIIDWLFTGNLPAAAE